MNVHCQRRKKGLKDAPTYFEFFLRNQGIVEDVEAYEEEVQVVPGKVLVNRMIAYIRQEIACGIGWNLS